MILVAVIGLGLSANAQTVLRSIPSDGKSIVMTNKSKECVAVTYRVRIGNSWTEWMTVTIDAGETKHATTACYGDCRGLNAIYDVEYKMEYCGRFGSNY